MPLKWKQRKDGAVMIPGYDTNTDPVGMVALLEGAGINKSNGCRCKDVDQGEVRSERVLCSC